MDKRVAIRNGDNMVITHTGKTTLHILVFNYKLSLNKILRVPEITKNLLSTSSLTFYNNIVVEFTKDKCFMKDKRLGKTLLEGALKHGLYHLLQPTAHDSTTSSYPISHLLSLSTFYSSTSSVRLMFYTKC